MMTIYFTLEGDNFETPEPFSNVSLKNKGPSWEAGGRVRGWMETWMVGAIVCLPFLERCWLKMQNTCGKTW